MGQAQIITRFREIQRELIARKKWLFNNTKRNEQCPCNVLAFSKLALAGRMSKIFGRKYKNCCWLVAR